MVQRTKIEWTDYAVNPLKYELPGETKPVNLCVKCSSGCAGCYAESIVNRFHGRTYSLGVMNEAKPVVVEQDIRHILRFRPRPPFKNGRRPMVFPFDMTDLFGEWVPFDVIDEFFAAFALRPDVDFQILSKRSARMAEYFSARSFIDLVSSGRWVWKQGQSNTSPLSMLAQRMSHEDQVRDRPGQQWQITLPERWPLPNVWLGVSVENQGAANARIPHLLDTPAAVRFLSVEPMLGPVQLGVDDDFFDHGVGRDDNNEPRIHWVIVGGESGPGSRPMHPAWARSIRDQCRDAGVPFFFKQWGNWVPWEPDYDAGAVKYIKADGTIHDQPGTAGATNQPMVRLSKKSSRRLDGRKHDEFPEDLRVREWPKAIATEAEAQP